MNTVHVYNEVLDTDIRMLTSKHNIDFQDSRCRVMTVLDLRQSWERLKDCLKLLNVA
jgi:hypothetical protein